MARPTRKVCSRPFRIGSASGARPGAVSDATSVAKLSLPNEPEALPPQAGSTMRRVWTAVRMFESPPLPASWNVPVPSMKKGRFSE